MTDTKKKKKTLYCLIRSLQFIPPTPSRRELCDLHLCIDVMVQIWEKRKWVDEFKRHEWIRGRFFLKKLYNLIKALHDSF